jgi:hypothetical protein
VIIGGAKMTLSEKSRFLAILDSFLAGVNAPPSDASNDQTDEHAGGRGYDEAMEHRLKHSLHSPTAVVRVTSLMPMG